MTGPRFGPTSSFQSCPAATGEAAPGLECHSFPDGAHRCGNARGPHLRHRCTCRYEWVSLTADHLNDSDVQAILHLPKHEARP